jgi:hypothetical protein
MSEQLLPTAKQLSASSTSLSLPLNTNFAVFN